MRIVFIRAYHDQSPYQWSMPPLGIGYMMAVLKRRFPQHEILFCMTIEEAIEARPTLLAISSATENFGQAQSFACRAKEAFGCPVIIGGSHVTALPQTMPDCFDAGVIGEGEPVIAGLVEALRNGKFQAADLQKIPGIVWRADGQIRVNDGGALMVENLDALPYPDRDGLGYRWAVPYSREVHLISSRGCPYDCSFCSSGRGHIRFRRFSAEYVAREIEALRERYDPEEIFFFDDLFIADRAHFRAVCEQLRRRRLHENILFRSYARVNLVDAELLDLFEEMNFRYIDFGFESNSERILRYYNKTGVTPEVNQRALDLTRDRAISIGANIIVGASDETLEDMQTTYDFIERNQDAIDRLSMGPLLAIPGTRVWDEAVARGLVSETMDDWTRLSFNPAHWDFERYPLLSRTMTARQLSDFIQRFLELEYRINDKGQRRKNEADSLLREQRYLRLRREMNVLKGSRFVRWALKARDWKTSLFGKP
ncbi:MAG: radical SAM protein [Candidatus Sumerlaeota bacterium]|nr:radical SAM protein [Candidatus Sumerlaeota bacterium]